MGAITPSFMFDLESNMQNIAENEYARLSQNMYWSRFCKVLPSQTRKQLVNWIISTAKIEDLGKSGGKTVFEDMLATYTTFESRNAGSALQLKRQQLMDLDGNGVDLAAKWAADIGAYMAYWPQKQFASALKTGHISGNNSYDGVPFFSGAHPLSGVTGDLNTFTNLFTTGLGPGACPIDTSVSADVALANLGKAIAYVKSIKMPNAEDPRYLSPTAIIVPPALQQRVVQLTNAKFLSGGSSGANDVEAIVSSYGFTLPVIASELAGFENDSTYFVACEELSSASQLGAMVYVDREPFAITYYSGRDGGTGMDAFLDRADNLEWHCKGRNVMGYGHPYLMFKVKAT